MASQDSGYTPASRSCTPGAWVSQRYIAGGEGVSLGVELGPLAETHPPTRPIPS